MKRADRRSNLHVYAAAEESNCCGTDIIANVNLFAVLRHLDNRRLIRQQTSGAIHSGLLLLCYPALRLMSDSLIRDHATLSLNLQNPTVDDETVSGMAGTAPGLLEHWRYGERDCYYTVKLLRWLGMAALLRLICLIVMS